MILLMLLVLILFLTVYSVSLSTWIAVKMYNTKRNKKEEILDVYKDDE